MMKDSEYIQVDLVKIAEGMLRRVWMIILAMLLCGSIAFSYATFGITPLYEAKTLMYVNNSSFSVGATSFSLSELSAAKSLVDTYMVILRTRATLNDVIRVGELDRTYESLQSMLSAESVNETEVFSVTVTSPDPQEAEHIANTIARVLPDKISGIVEGSSVRIVDYAVVPSDKVSPSIQKYTVVGLLGGLLLSCAAIAVIEIVDDQIHSENYLLENYAEIPLLSTVPDLMDDSKGKGYYYNYYKHSDYTQNNNSAGKKGKRA